MKYKLSDAILINPKEVLAKGTIAKKISMDKLQPFSRDVPTFEQELFSGGSKFRNSDTIMARITPCLENGKTAKVNVLNDNEVGFGSTEFIVLRAMADFTDEDYVYYLACSPLIRDPAIKSMVGSSGRQRVQTDVLANLVLEIPDLPRQRKIGALLKSIDDKIANNNAINNNLHQQAQALFKDIFIDFTETNGEISSTWKQYRLADFLPVITGKKNANVSSAEGNYPFFSCSQDIAWTDDYSFDGSAILVAGNGDFNVKWYNGKFEAYQRTYVLIPHCFRYTAWLYYAIKYNLNTITSAARGSVIKFITKGNLENFMFYAPIDLNDYEIIDTFTKINLTIDARTQENHRLATLRDALLPKLMSGEIDVSKVEI